MFPVIRMKSPLCIFILFMKFWRYMFISCKVNRCGVVPSIICYAIIFSNSIWENYDGDKADKYNG